MLAHSAGGFRSADPRGPLHFVGLSDLHQQVHRAGELADQLEPLRPVTSGPTEPAPAVDVPADVAQAVAADPAPVDLEEVYQ